MKQEILFDIILSVLNNVECGAFGPEKTQPLLSFSRRRLGVLYDQINKDRDLLHLTKRDHMDIMKAFEVARILFDEVDSHAMIGYPKADIQAAEAILAEQWHMNTSPIINYDNATEHLVQRIPEFAVSQEYKDSYDDIPYMVFGSFASFLIRLVKNEDDPENRAILQKAISFIDDMATETDSKTNDLLGAGLIEELMVDPAMVTFLKSHLKPETVEDSSELFALSS